MQQSIQQQAIQRRGCPSRKHQQPPSLVHFDDDHPILYSGPETGDKLVVVGVCASIRLGWREVPAGFLTADGIFSVTRSRWSTEQHNPPAIAFDAPLVNELVRRSCFTLLVTIPASHGRSGARYSISLGAFLELASDEKSGRGPQRVVSLSSWTKVPSKGGTQ